MNVHDVAVCSEIPNAWGVDARCPNPIFIDGSAAVRLNGIRAGGVVGVREEGEREGREGLGNLRLRMWITGVLIRSLLMDQQG